MEFNKKNFFNNISNTISQIRDEADNKVNKTKEEYYLNYVNKYVKRKLSKAKFLRLINTARYHVIDDILKSELRHRSAAADYKSNLFFSYSSRFKQDKLASKGVNSVLNSMLEKYNPFNDKRPSKHLLGTQIGVEIECLFPFGVDDWSESCSDCCWSNDSDREYEGNDCCSEHSIQQLKQKLGDKIKKNKITNVQIKTDGSLTQERDVTPLEITIITDVNDFSNLEGLCKILNEMGAYVDSTCGLHVHLDQRDVSSDLFKVNTRGRRLSNALPFLAQLVPKSRLDNRFCKLAKNKMNGQRYYAINMASYSQHKTIEVRLHSGTTSFKKISNWIKIVYSIQHNVRFSKRQKNNSIDNFIELLNFKNDELNYYIYERYKNFNTKINNHNEEMQSEGPQTVMIPSEVNTETVPF